MNKTKILIIIFAIASGMAYLLSKGIIHHDLKPYNIFIDKKIWILKSLILVILLKIQILKNLSRQLNSKMQNDPNYFCSWIYKSKRCLFIRFDRLWNFDKRKTFQSFEKYKSNLNRSRHKKWKAKISNVNFDDDRIPECYKELIEAFLAQNPNERPTFDQIVHISEKW